MADPLSAAAGIVGVLTAAVQITRLLIEFTKRTKAAPRQASQVLSEVNDVHTIMTQLQAFLFGLNTPDQSQACHVQVASLISILTGCVATFSDLEQLLDQMRSEDLRMLDRLKWAKKESTIELLISRLQVHKNSLTLILEIVNGSTMQDVKTTVHRLDKTMNDNYQEILSRLRALEMPPSTSQRLPSRTSTSDASAAARLSYSAEGHQLNPAHRHQRLSKVFDFLFERELAISKVYRNTFFGGSSTSLLTTDDPKTRWSVLSAPSIADVVSSLSVLNLAITTAEVYNAAQYRPPDIELSETTALDPMNRALGPEMQFIIYKLYDLSIKQYVLLNRQSNSSNNFFQGLDPSWTQASSIELIHRIYVSLNLPLSMMETCWYKPRLFMSFLQSQKETNLVDRAAGCWAELTEHTRPLQLFARLREIGRQPVLLLSVAKQPYHRGNKTLKMHEVGYTMDGWVIDAELSRLSMAYMQRRPVKNRSRLPWI